MESVVIYGAHLELSYLYYNILISHEQWNGRGLHRRHAIEAHSIDRIENPWRQRFRQLVPRSRVLLSRLITRHFESYIKIIVLQPRRRPRPYLEIVIEIFLSPYRTSLDSLAKTTA